VPAGRLSPPASAVRVATVFYRPTAAGRKHLQSERERWTRLASAVAFVLAGALEEDARSFQDCNGG
jgi:DNA-binding PadR family transcriptional regulator